jgi:protein TonB
MNIEKYVAPVYPRGARRRGLTGNVTMNFSIRADGTTGDIEVISSRPGNVFVSSAKKAVSEWRFEPPGEVVTAQVNIRFEKE